MTAVGTLPRSITNGLGARRSSGWDRAAERSTVRARRLAPAAHPSIAGVLPSPPDVHEKYCYIRRHIWVLISCSVISFGCLTLSQWRLVHSTPWMWLYLPFLLFTILYYVVSLSVNAFSKDFDLHAHRRLRTSWRPTAYPDVDVFLPVCGEPLEVMKNTWVHVTRMMQYYQGTVTSYVLDDGGDRAVAAMAAEFGFVYKSRSNRGWFKKAGNLRYGFQRSSGEYILVLDADFAPRHDLLNELLPYLECNRRVAIVQSPQFFRALDQQNWIERGAGVVQELFYRAIQVSRQRVGGAICVGTCAVYRRAALRENGGPTLIEHSEDVHTGFDLRCLGWDLRYVPIALATGLCPNTSGAFQVQQYRWCSGSLSLLSSKKFWRARLRLRNRMCYMSGFFYYIHTALFTFVGPLIPITLLLAMP
ncbi:MAG TPA: cellulose synthase catalytic subunit, partial [Propionibacteriaceae bacterium]|nr:cellulose synthase catalytic subunit [Propionibacteriaceae bacterium]